MRVRTPMSATRGQTKVLAARRFGYPINPKIYVSGPSLRTYGFIEIRRRAIKPTQARIGVGDHPGQRLLDFVGDGGRNRIPGYQPRLALAALGEDRAEQL